VGGVFGGDSSVVWKVDARRVRETTVTSRSTVHHHGGTDETPENGFFTITINLPTDPAARADFFAQLRKYTANPEPRDPLVVRIPIEDVAYLTAKKQTPGTGTQNQILVDWP